MGPPPVRTASRSGPPPPRVGRLAGAAAARAEALDLASFRGRDVVRTPAHLAHEPLLLHLAPELPEGLLELFGILDYDSHDRTRIPADAIPARVRAPRDCPRATWGGGGSSGLSAAPAAPPAPPARPARPGPPGRERGRSRRPRR